MYKMRLAIYSGLAIAMIVIPSNLTAATIFLAALNGAQEVPPNVSTATGNAMVTLSGNTLTVSQTFSGLIGGNAAAAHIHCCAPLGVADNVAVPFPGFPAATSGTYTQSFDLSLAATYNPGFLTAHGGTVASAEADFIAGLNAGLTYANIHNRTFGGGEIRGQFIPVPEPSTGLLLLALAPIAGLMRRRFSR